jgi:NADPH:quinone reductase-like Zn-dependent oxidoreductase
MRAIILNGTCEANMMKVSRIALPAVKPGWVLVKAKAFGLNHAELVLRQYEVDASYIKKPIVPGIECVGVIEDPSDSRFKKGEKVVALMGGMGRSFNGSYAEYVLLPQSHVFAVSTTLDWINMAAVPETFFTAYGSLFECLQLEKDDTLLVHGATSALGLAAIQLAKTKGCIVIGTSRKSERLDFLRSVGADYALIDNESLNDKILEIFLNRISKILELVGPTAIPKTSKLLKKHGIICSTGQLGGNLKGGFDVIKNIPNGVYLSSFYSNYPTQDIMDNIFKMIDEHHIIPIIGNVMTLDEIGIAHELMERNQANGKIVIRVDA